VISYVCNKTEIDVTHPDYVVAECAVGAKALVKGWLKFVRHEDLLRLDAIQDIADAWTAWFERAAFETIFETLTELGALRAGACPKCGLARERDRKPVRVRTKRLALTVDVFRYRCRPCKTSCSPVRNWLGLESGQTTAGFDRAVSALATELSFGATATQMLEQHGHEVDRTLVERRTYEVGVQAVEYLEERAMRQVDEYMERPPTALGAERVELQVDSGGVRVGQLERPALSEASKLTPVRGLPVGRRPSARREVRAIVAKQPGVVSQKIVDLHVAPLNHTEITGEKMFIAALEAGLGSGTHVHGTFDMAQWQAQQFQEQFDMQPRWTICADFFHAMEYVAGAAPGVVEESERVAWRKKMARHLMAAERGAIIGELGRHTCRDGRCPRTDGGECAVKAAVRYLTKHGKYMDYPTYVSEGLPIGSGEIEGLIRHAVKRRLDIPGDWTEKNLRLMAALLTVRHSGWWDDFWRWRDERDRGELRQRLAGLAPSRFRGPARQRARTNGQEILDLEELSPMFWIAIG
jgi:hypothetical protein